MADRSCTLGLLERGQEGVECCGGRLTLPRIRSASVRNLSLYSSEPVVNVTFTDGVFCLAGANGLGKSTFLATINYALTGVVPDPERKFDSIAEYYRNSLGFSRRFFTGKVSEIDRDAAEASLCMDVGGREYVVTRGLFEPDELRMLSIRDKASGEQLADSGSLSPEDRHTSFKEHIVRDVGLEAFDQLVFLQHFVFTFDERRHLLFWDEKALERVLYLTFGLDYAEARKADSLRRESEKADSLARNRNWQANEILKKLEDLEVERDQAESPQGTVASEYQALTRTVEDHEASLDRIEMQMRDASAALNNQSTEYALLRTQYADMYSIHVNGTAGLLEHPLVKSSLADATCGICGATGEAVRDAISVRVQQGQCPLCGSDMAGRHSENGVMAQLRDLDKRLVQVKSALDESARRTERLRAEREQASGLFLACKDRLCQFEEQNKLALAQMRAANDQGLRAVIERYEQQRLELLTEKERQYQIRNAKRRELLAIQTRMAKQYALAERDFVPRFRDLAFQFLGLDLDVRMETKSFPSVCLVLEVRSSARREYYQLSESQRFFVDIALRMAVAEFLSAGHSKACILVDTPEGSLDIAYEDRAGDMIASFVSRGHQVIMTANINSSRLVLALAEQCGTALMALCRMTSWTELSEVQIAEEALFTSAYDQIERALSQGGRQG